MNVFKAASHSQFLHKFQSTLCEVCEWQAVYTSINSFKITLMLKFPIKVMKTKYLQENFEAESQLFWRRINSDSLHHGMNLCMNFLS